MPVDVVRVEDSIFQLRINDPAHANALTDACIQEVIEGTRHLCAEPNLKVLLLTGLPDVFCSGAPKERLLQAARGERGPTENAYWPLLDAITSFPLPVVAALEGHAIGGGLMLALLFADMLVAAESSRYGVNFSSLGITPGMGATMLLPRLVGRPFAAEMLLGGKLFTGHELCHRGIFNDVVPHPEVHEVALNLARRIAEKPRYVLVSLKATLAGDRREGLQAATNRECELQRSCLEHDEAMGMIETMYLTRTEG